MRSILGLFVLLVGMAAFADDALVKVRKVARTRAGVTEVVLEPPISPRFLALVEAGEVKEGELLRCRLVSRELGPLKDAGRVNVPGVTPTMVVTVLECGKQTFIVKGILFERAK